MNYQKGNQRNQSLFQKGMSLQQYMRGMDFNEGKIPTADTYDQVPDENQQCLYKTTHNFYNPPPKPNVSAIKEIQQQSYDDSIDHYRQSKNVVSTNLKKLGKQSLAVVEDTHKKYRIRNGGSMSPYGNIKKKKNDFSPTKTFGAKFYRFQEQLPANFIVSSNNNSPTLMSINQEGRTSQKKIPKNTIHNIHKNYQPCEITTLQNMNITTSKWHTSKLSPNKFTNALQKVDFRVQTLKGRIQKKKKAKKSPM